MIDWPIWPHQHHCDSWPCSQYRRFASPRRRRESDEVCRIQPGTERLAQESGSFPIRGLSQPNLHRNSKSDETVFNIYHSSFCKITWIMSSLSLGETDSPQISSPLAREDSNCSPIEARSNSFQTIAVSCFLHFILQVPPLQMWGSSHSGGLSSRIKW